MSERIPCNNAGKPDPIDKSVQVEESDTKGKLNFESTTSHYAMSVSSAFDHSLTLSPDGELYYIERGKEKAHVNAMPNGELERLIESLKYCDSIASRSMVGILLLVRDQRFRCFEGV